jgi:hypothetical protein
MTTICTFTNQIDAAFDLSLLQANGFDAVLLDEGSFQWNYAGMAIPIRLQVPEEQAQRAIQSLKDFHSAEPSSEDAS